MNTTINSRSGEKGFTLVELAIVMIIIGLLIGGILKGQELIANARLASAVSKVKAIDAAINTFRDSYSALPGDILAPTTRIPGCVAANICGQAGNGNSRIGVEPGAAQVSTTENITAWAQLARADLLGGVQDLATGSNIGGGTTNPSAEVPGQIYVGYTAGGVTAGTATAAARAGHYLLIHNGAGGGATSTIATAGTTGTVSLTPAQASRIDAKLDDEKPNAGSVLAMGTPAATTGCADAATDAGVYVTSNGSAVCGVYIRIQQ